MCVCVCVSFAQILQRATYQDTTIELTWRELRMHHVIMRSSSSRLGLYCYMDSYIHIKRYIHIHIYAYIHIHTYIDFSVFFTLWYSVTNLWGYARQRSRRDPALVAKTRLPPVVGRSIFRAWLQSVR